MVGTLACNEVIARNLFATLYHGVVGQHIIHLLNHLLRTLLASGRRQRDGNEERSRVFVRNKSRFGCAHSEHQHHNTHQHGHTCNDAMLDDVLYTPAIFAQHFVESHVETSVETVYKARLTSMFALGMRFQEDGAKRRRKGKGVDGRDDDRHGHRYTELAIERSRRAADKRYGDKHAGHNQRNGDNGARNLVHGVDGGHLRTLITHIQLGVHGLNHHNGIVYHDGNGQQQGRER